MSRQTHEGLDIDGCMGLLNIFKEDCMMLFIPLITESVHRNSELAPPENVVLNICPGRIRAGMLYRKGRPSSEPH